MTQHSTLTSELAHRAAELAKKTAGRERVPAPRQEGPHISLTSELAHRAAELAKRTAETKGVPAPELDEQGLVAPARRRFRTDKFRPSKEELDGWKAFYRPYDWYQNTQHDSPFAVALPYACDEQDGVCNALASNRLIYYYEECKPKMVRTKAGSTVLAPGQFTEVLRRAYQAKDKDAVLILASSFRRADELGELEEALQRAWYPKIGAEHQADERQALASASGEQTPPSSGNLVSSEQRASSARTSQTPPSSTPPSQTKEVKNRARAVVLADVHAGRAIMPSGDVVTFTPLCSLAELARTIKAAGACDQISLSGALPPDYKAWLTDASIWQEYTTAKRGMYFDQKQEEDSVARYQHRASGEELDVRSLYAWYGDAVYTVEEAHQALALLNLYIKAAFTADDKAYATPALTFTSLWTRQNRIYKRQFAPLADETREKIRASSGQGRIELCTPAELDKVPGIHYYDGIFTYSALSWGMPTGIAAEDTKDEYAGKVPARYRIRYTVPATWQHIGVFMTPRDAVTGRQEDSHEWAYPGEDYQGRTFETWADGAELDALINTVYYQAPAEDTKEAKAAEYTRATKAALSAWCITILERIVYTVDTKSKPLDSITSKLADMRDKVETDARTDTDESRQNVYKLVRAALRNILLHGIGSFNRHSRDVTYILRTDEPAPDGYTGRRALDEQHEIYTVPQPVDKYTEQFEHPEWAALIWARCRARMTAWALTLPRKKLIAFRTDALAVTEDQPQWNNNTRRGTLRPKWRITRTVKAPHSFEELDALTSKYVKEA